MAGTKLSDVERMVDDLTPAEQLRLLQYLAPRLANAVLEKEPESGHPPADKSWEQFRRVGQELASLPNLRGFLTEAVGEMRR